MITVEIKEDVLLNLLIDRVEFWTSNETILSLYKDYYKNMINSGYFDNCKLDIISIVDNDYINYFAAISKEDFEQWNIKDKTNEKIVAFNEDKDLYLTRTY